MLIHRYLKGEETATQWLLDGALDHAAPPKVANRFNRKRKSAHQSIHVIHEADETFEEELERRNHFGSVLTTS